MKVKPFASFGKLDAAQETVLGRTGWSIIELDSRKSRVPLTPNYVRSLEGELVQFGDEILIVAVVQEGLSRPSGRTAPLLLCKYPLRDLEPKK